MDLVKQVVKWLQYRKIFSRERKSNEKRAQEMLLYNAGLSYKKAGIFVNASHKAIWEWYQKGKELFKQSTQIKIRKRIAIDEKEIVINGTTVFIWGAVGLDDEKVIATWVSFGRSSLEATAFLKRVRGTCNGRLPRVFIDGGTWYPWALKKIGFKRYSTAAFGYRSAIERFFGGVERRIRLFWNGFVGNYNVKSMKLWIEAFAGFRNCSKDLEES